MKRLTILTALWITFLACGRGIAFAALQFDFMDHPVSFWDTDTQRFLEEVKNSSSVQTLGEKFSDATSPDKVTAIGQQASNAVEQSESWLKDKAGINVRDIFVHIGQVFISTTQWMVNAIKGVLK